MERTLVKKQGGNNRPNNLGITPTVQQKLLYIGKKLGLRLEDMQGSTVNLVDTVIIGTNAAARQTLSFFTQTQNKSRNFSNFQNGTLNAGEAMVMENVSFFVLSLDSNNLTLDSNTITGMWPLSSVPTSIIPKGEALKYGLMNILIANQRVVKDYSLFEADPSYNPKTTGIEVASLLDGSAAPGEFIVQRKVIGQNGIMLESPPVLPPNQKTEITLEVPPVGDIPAGVAIMCVVGRFGSIFSSKTPL